jgi:hypothetical protein
VRVSDDDDDDDRDDRDDDDDDDDDDGDGGRGGGRWGGGTDSGSSSSGRSACERYVDAWSQCVEEFGGDAADYGLTDGYCDAYTDSSYAGLLNCYADAISAGDCSTTEGYTEAANEAAMCAG